MYVGEVIHLTQLIPLHVEKYVEMGSEEQTMPVMMGIQSQVMDALNFVL